VYPSSASGGPGERSSIPNVDEDLLEELLAAGVKVKVK